MFLVVSPSSSSLLYHIEGVNVASLLTCDEQVANTPCSHVTSMNGEHVPFSLLGLELVYQLARGKNTISTINRESKKIIVTAVTLT